MAEAEVTLASVIAWADQAAREEFDKALNGQGDTIAELKARGAHVAYRGCLLQLHALRARLEAREQSLSKSLEQTRVFGVLGDDDCLRIRLEDVRAILGEAENEYTECYCPLCDLVVPASEESKHQHTSEVRAILGEECACVDPVPAYSTDPAAALAALEQAAAGREWSVDLHTSAFAVGWYCTILDEQTREEYHGEGASLAEAVSRAICKAVQSVGDAPS